jgi:hypothetical protein
LVQAAVTQRQHFAPILPRCEQFKHKGNIMNEQRTTSILKRLPVILAVTAASYGLPSQAQGQRAERDGQARHALAGAALERMREDMALQD